MAASSYVEYALRQGFQNTQASAEQRRNSGRGASRRDPAREIQSKAEATQRIACDRRIVPLEAIVAQKGSRRRRGARGRGEEEEAALREDARTVGGLEEGQRRTVADERRIKEQDDRMTSGAASSIWDFSK